MKIQIRRNVFETNSSHEHSISIVKSDDWTKWIKGEVMGRIINIDRKPGWGNFDSEMFIWEFSSDKDKCILDNQLLLNKIKETGLANKEKYKNDCLNHKPLVEKLLTPEEEEKLSNEEFNEYQLKVYEDQYYIFDEENYNYWKDIYENLTLDNMHDTISMVLEKFWMTYEDYKRDWLDCDCVSPWEHEYKELGLHAFGKYFHS